MKLITIIKALLLLGGIMVLSFLLAFGLILLRQEKLSEKALSLQKGMKIQDVIELMGPPEYYGLTESQNVVKGWDSKWGSNYEEIKKKNEIYKVCDYYLEYCWFPFMKKIRGTLVISVYFSYLEDKIVYVSEYHHME